MSEDKQSKRLSSNICEGCFGDLVEGIFYSACPVCRPFMFLPCRSCGEKRIYCCC
mgnify:CR=1 FL=1